MGIPLSELPSKARELLAELTESTVRKQDEEIVQEIDVEDCDWPLEEIRAEAETVARSLISTLSNSSLFQEGSINKFMGKLHENLLKGRRFLKAANDDQTIPWATHVQGEGGDVLVVPLRFAEMLNPDYLSQDEHRIGNQLIHFVRAASRTLEKGNHEYDRTASRVEKFKELLDVEQLLNFF